MQPGNVLSHHIDVRGRLQMHTGQCETARFQDENVLKKSVCECRVLQKDGDVRGHACRVRGNARLFAAAEYATTDVRDSAVHEAGMLQSDRGMCKGCSVQGERTSKSELCKAYVFEEAMPAERVL
jgi:hypothetical protein